MKSRLLRLIVAKGLLLPFSHFCTSVLYTMRARNFCITFYPEAAVDHQDYTQWWTSLEGCTYAIFGLENCPDTGRPHYQGYAEFASAQTATVIQAAHQEHWDKGVHLERREGTQKQAVDYCKKDGNWIESGELKRQGKSREADRLMDMVKDGANVRDILQAASGHAWCQYRAGLKEAMTLLRPLRDPETPPTVIIYYGITGTGKTLAARSAGALPTVFREPFVSGSLGPKVLFDDFDPQSMTRTWFLLLTDRYQQTVEVKGGEAEWAPTHIYFTTNYEPSTWMFKDNQKWDAACARRITEIKEMV